MIRRPPSSTRTDTLFPYTTLFRSPGSPYPARAIGQKRRKEKSLDARRGGLAVRALDRGGPSRRFSIAATWPSREPVAPRKAGRRHPAGGTARGDRKSTRLLQSLMRTSYAVFCLTKKTLPI